jgi:hypothetical protein
MVAIDKNMSVCDGDLGVYRKLDSKGSARSGSDSACSGT